MIMGLGIDSVDIQRFSEWHTYSSAQLRRILSNQEIEHCKQNKLLSAQRFAARFAIREAFFKAWNSALPENYIPFLTCCRSLSLTRNRHNAPLLQIDWAILGNNAPLFTPLVSLTHTASIATACIFLKNIST
jgi:phosphopantetheine--protein transferase-like protein